MDVPTTIALLDDPTTAGLVPQRPPATAETTNALDRPLYSHAVEAVLEYLRLACDLSDGDPPLRLAKTNKAGGLAILQPNTSKKTFIEAAGTTLMRYERTQQPYSLADCIALATAGAGKHPQGQGRRRLVMVATAASHTALLSEWQAWAADFSHRDCHWECCLVVLEANPASLPLPASDALTQPALTLCHHYQTPTLHSQCLRVAPTVARLGLQQLACQHLRAQPVQLRRSLDGPVTLFRHLGSDIACPRPVWRTSTSDASSPLGLGLGQLTALTTWPSVELTVAASYRVTLASVNGSHGKQLVRELRKPEVALHLFHDDANVYFSLRLDLNGDLMLR